MDPDSLRARTEHELLSQVAITVPLYEMRETPITSGVDARTQLSKTVKLYINEVIREYKHLLVLGEVFSTDALC